MLSCDSSYFSFDMLWLSLSHQVIDQKKSVGNTAGMQSTVNTIQLFCERLRYVKEKNK